MTLEEEEAYESMKSLPGEFDDSEKILINLVEIEWCREKFEIWCAVLKFDDELQPLQEHINNYIGAFEVIKESKSLKKVLSYALAIGNILNGGTNKGQADGFTLDAIAKLSTLKDVNGKTLLQTIAIKIKNEDENFGNIRREFEKCEEAIKIPLGETKTGVSTLMKTTDSIVETFKKVKAQDDFMKKMKPVVFGNQEKIHKLDELIKESANIAQKCIAYFGYPKSDMKFKKPDDFLLLVSDFAKDLDKAIPVTEAKKVFKGQQPIGKKITEKNSNNTNMDSVMAGLKAKLGSK